MAWFVEKIEIPADGRGTGNGIDVGRTVRTVGDDVFHKRRERRLAIIRDPHHLAGRVLFRRAVATLFRPLVFGRAAHRVIMPAFLENQMHVGFVGRAVEEPRTKPVAVSCTVLAFRIAGNRPVQREGDAVEQRGLAGARLAVDEEHVRSGERREVDGVLPFVWADATEFHCDEFHCATSLPAFLRTVSTASRSTSFSAGEGVRPIEYSTKSRSTSISSVVCFKSAIFRLSCDCFRCE